MQRETDLVNLAITGRRTKVADKLVHTSNIPRVNPSAKKMRLDDLMQVLQR
jgi:hypothetical protein